MFKWFKRKAKIEMKEPKVIEDNRGSPFTGCKVTFLISQDKNVKVICDWPNLPTDEQKFDMATTYAKLFVNFIQKDVLTQYVAPVIVFTSQQKGPDDAPFLRTLLGLMENLLLEKEADKMKVDNAPVVSPLAVFKVRG